MGFWSNLFGRNKKPKISRTCAPVSRLAKKRGCSVYDLDLDDSSIIEELLLLGLILDDNGNYYEDPLWNDFEEQGVGYMLSNVAEGSAYDIDTQDDSIGCGNECGCERPPSPLPLPPPPPPPPPPYEPPEQEERESWTSESSESSWSSDDSGGFDD